MNIFVGKTEFEKVRKEVERLRKFKREKALSLQGLKMTAAVRYLVNELAGVLFDMEEPEIEKESGCGFVSIFSGLYEIGKVWLEWENWKVLEVRIDVMEVR